MFGFCESATINHPKRKRVIGDIASITYDNAFQGKASCCALAFVVVNSESSSQDQRRTVRLLGHGSDRSF
jgi:hypothetical protein